MADEIDAGPADFLSELQNLASMCERSLSIQDGPMLAAKFRDAAFCLSVAATQGAADRALIHTLRANLATAEEERDAAIARAKEAEAERDDALKTLIRVRGALQ